MKTKLCIVLILLGSLVLLPGLVAAQGTVDPQKIVDKFVTDGYISTSAGEVVFEGDKDTIDVSGEDNYFSNILYKDHQLSHFAMGGNITWGPGATDDDCGFVLRYVDDSNYYYAGINQDGQVRFDEISSGEWQDPQLFDTKLITTGEGQTNLLVVLAVGPDFGVFVNGKEAALVNDDSNAEGQVGLGMSTYEGSDKTSCDFSDVFAYQFTGGSDTGTETSSQAITLTAYDQTPKEAVAELRDLGLVPAGGSQVFLEDYAYFTGVGSWFTPLARQNPFTNVVMAGELTYTVGTTDEIETCALMARTVLPADNTGTTTYTEVGLDNAGEVYMMDAVNGENVISNAVPLNLDYKQPHHLLFIVQDNTVTVFVDGEMVMDQFEINKAHPGTYGISLLGKGDKARCDGKNIWVYELD